MKIGLQICICENVVFQSNFRSNDREISYAVGYRTNTI